MTTLSGYDAEEAERRKEDKLRYSTEIIDDISPARKLLEEYSGIPSENVVSHIKAVRDKAWSIHPYPCVGRFRFLDLSISLHPAYSSLLTRLKTTPTTLLDLGCCFGQDIRSLVFDGAPGENLWGSDLRPAFWELGYELFRDKETLKARFVEGDVFDDSPEAPLAQLNGKVDVLHAASFLHLFTWEEQVRVGKRMVKLLRGNVGVGGDMVLGRQGGVTQPGLENGRWRHDPASFQRLWDQVGEETGSKWEVKAELMRGWGRREDEWAVDENRRVLQFTIHRVG